MIKPFINRAFTLIELLIVISIIGILAALATASYTSAQRQARDTTRKSDMSQYRTSLELYANKNNSVYPIFGSKVDPSTNLCTLLGLTCPGPEDPKNTDPSGLYYYQYQSNNAGTDYVLWVNKMENSTSRWAVCSNGKSGYAASGLPPTSGTATCPL
jgi:prepilin-type N-terminal cleavage/methylation domain-containing protein